MKKVAILTMLLLILAVATSASAEGVTPSWKVLKDTTWVGVITFVDPVAGSQSEDNATLEFKTEDGRFLSGTIACTKAPCNKLLDAGTPFSCIRKGNQLLMTADGSATFAVLSMGRPAKKGNPPPQYLMLEGSRFEGAYTFIGKLTKQ